MPATTRHGADATGIHRRDEFMSAEVNALHAPIEWHAHLIPERSFAPWRVATLTGRGCGRPRRSSFQTTSTSPVRSARTQLSSPGRSSRTPDCQGRSKSRPRWRRKTRPPSRWGGVFKSGCADGLERSLAPPEGRAQTERRPVRTAGGVAGGEASGRRGGCGVPGLLAVGETVALAVQLQDVDVMGEPVEQGAGQPFRAEDLRPFVERQI